VTPAPLRALLLAATLAAAPAAAALQGTGKGGAFTQKMADRFRAAAPAGAEVRITGPLELSLRSGAAGSEPYVIGIGGIWRGCVREPAGCEAATSHFIAQTLLVATEAAPPPFTRAHLRLAVRGRPYCEAIGQAAANHGGDANSLLMRDMAPDLCMIVMVEYAERRRGLNVSDLGPLGLSAEEAWRTAQAQTLGDLPRPGTLEGLESGRILALSDTEYAPSLLLDAEGWRAIAASRGGVIVAVPADNLLVVAHPQVTDLAGLKRSIREAFEAADRGVSPNLYRWTAQGWSVVE
jgi:hypothetical protein